ncbi:Uncharacterized protein TCM_021454 [Theobroma cacao]|uniref:Uncharacterized protein n=1 Tax=Theobroma cacao TaxID=3641 RepID=A0A061EP86_THECC|nr:Uncharacterized protein TCM_021454 [Theobroma cacao]
MRKNGFKDLNPKEKEMLKSDQVFKRSRHVLQSHWYGQKHPKRRQMPFVGRKREDMPKFISSNSEIQQPTILLKEKRVPLLSVLITMIHCTGDKLILIFTWTRFSITLI